MSNQNNNEEWIAEFDETISNVMGIMQIDSLKIKDFIAAQIQAAEKRGKREGLEELRANYELYDWGVYDPFQIINNFLKKLNQ